MFRSRTRQSAGEYQRSPRSGERGYKMNTSPEFLLQYEALTRGCGFAELPRTIIEVRGADRTQFLHSFCTNDVKRLVPGQGCEAFITNHQGKTLGHVFIFCEAERLIMGTVANQAASPIAHLERFVISEDVTFRDLSGQFTVLLVAGEQAAHQLRKLSGAEPPSGLLNFAPCKIAGCDGTIFRVEYAGPQSFFVRAMPGDVHAIVAALGGAGARACQPAAIEACRLEAGFPLFGRDITDDNLPQEVNRTSQAISFTKGCYLGQETVARIDALGHVNRLLVGLKFAGGDPPPPGTKLVAGDKPVGNVTSSAWSPALQTPLALAYVRRSSAAPGSQLQSDSGPAEVIALPVSQAAHP